MLLWILQHQQKLFENDVKTLRKCAIKPATESSVVNKERNICQIFDVALLAYMACNGKKLY